MTNRPDSTEPTSTLFVFASHMAYVGIGPHPDHGMLTITGLRINCPARWGSGEGAVIYFVDDQGSLNQLNLQRHHLDQLRDALNAENAEKGEVAQ